MFGFYEKDVTLQWKHADLSSLPRHFSYSFSKINNHKPS